MPANQKYRKRSRRAPPIDEAAWLWALGFEAESRAIQPYLRYVVDEREPALWSAHAEAIKKECRRLPPGDNSKPPIQRRLEEAAAEPEEAQHWSERYEK